MDAYHALAASYDRLTEDVDYGEIFAYMQELLRRAGKNPRSLLDLGCGTASLSLLFAEKGLKVTALDLSEEMLTLAASKAEKLPPSRRPRFLCCPMQKLALPEPVDCVIASLDSLNYVTDPEELKRIFCRVFVALNSGGIFIFDLNTEEKFRNLDGQIFLDEDEDVYCVWRADYEESSRMMTYGMDLFQREGKNWKRSWECHEERAYLPEEISDFLEKAAFQKIRIYGNGVFCPPEAGEHRIWICAEKE